MIKHLDERTSKGDEHETYLTQSSCHETLNDGATIVMQQVDFIDNQQLHNLGQGHVPCAFPGHHIPLFRGGHDHLMAAQRGHQCYCKEVKGTGWRRYLSAEDFRFGQLHVTRQLSHIDSKGLQAFAEIPHHLSCQRFHRRHVDDLQGRIQHSKHRDETAKEDSDLELILLDDPLGDVLFDFVHHRQHGDVGLPGSGRGTDQEVLVALVGSLKDDGLNAVEGPHAIERHLPNLWKPTL